jgi:hypothetical protein
VLRFVTGAAMPYIDSSGSMTSEVQLTIMKKLLIQLALLLTALVLVASSATGQWVGATGSSGTFSFAKFDSVVLGIGNGIYLSTNYGVNWTVRYPSPHATHYLTGYPATAVIGSHVFMGGAREFNGGVAGNTASFGGVYRSIDTGLTWNRTSQGLGDTNVFSLLVVGSKLFAGTESGLYVSTNEGANWTNGGLPLSRTVFSIATIGSVVLAGTDGGLFRSVDSGKTWSGVDSDLKFGSLYTSTAIVTNGPHVLASAYYYAKSQYPYLLLSSDSGLNWAVVDTVSAFSSFIANGGLLFQSLNNSYGRVFASKDNGRSFIDITDTGVGGFGVFHRAKTLVVSGPNLIVGTVETGIWYRPLSTILNSGYVKGITPSELDFAIHPNPLSSSTSVSFSTRRRSVVEVQIVDVLGKECAKLFKGVLDPGAHSYEWNAATMTAGVYFCTVRTENGIVQLPMIVQH